MRNVKVLGPGCARCKAIEDMVNATANKLGIDVNVEKITDYSEIAKFGIVSTPGVVVDGRVVHVGGLPKPEDMAKWLAA